MAIGYVIIKRGEQIAQGSFKGDIKVVEEPCPVGLVLTKERHGWFCFIQPKNFKCSNLSIVSVIRNKNFETDWHLKSIKASIDILNLIFKKQPDLAPYVLKNGKLYVCSLFNVNVHVHRMTQNRKLQIENCSTSIKIIIVVPKILLSCSNIW